jgi:DNA primase
VEADRWRLRFDERRDALLIPVFDANDNLVGCAWRYFAGDKRYVNMPGLQRDRLCYGLNEVVKSKIERVAVVEGFRDVWSCWRAGVPAVSTFGANMSTGQAETLYDAGVRHITMLYDNDAAGFSGAEKAHRYAQCLVVSFAMNYGKSAWPKDPGDDTTGDTIRSLFKNPVDLQTFYLHSMLQKERSHARRGLSKKVLDMEDDT